MDFSFTTEQTEIKHTMQRIFRDLCSDDAIKQLNPVFHKNCWAQLADSGVFALPFAEADGGVGLSLVELCLVLELQGQYVTPMPLISQVVEFGLTLAESDKEKLKEQILPSLIDGSSIYSFARPYNGLLQAMPLNAQATDAGLRINGRTGVVAYLPFVSGVLLELSLPDNKVALAFCDLQAEGIKKVEQIAINDEPCGYLQFDNTLLPTSNIVALGEQAQNLLLRQQQRRCIALAAVQLGVLDEGLRRTADYVSQRKQFGRSLGSFQAVSQQAANAYMEIECLRSVYWRALDNIENQRDLSDAAAVVKYWISQAGHVAAHTILHLHGGIGQDLDYPIHRYFLFAKQIERQVGSQDELGVMLGERLCSDNAAATLAELCQ